jgi:hypothetical protein
MKQIVTSLALALGLAACAGPGGSGPGGGLMYRVPESPAAVYLTGDTSNIDIDAGAMGSFRMRETATSTVAFTFARAEEGVRVTANFQELSARLTQPMGGAQSITEADVVGDFVFTLDPQGHSTAVSTPEVRGAVAPLANLQALAYEFFPILPGGAVGPGDSWTDTLSYALELPQGDSESTSVMTYTLQGDTAVDGRTLLHIALTGTNDVTQTGVLGGMDVILTISGDIEGTILWDAARSLYVSGDFRRDMDGTVEVPTVGMPPVPMTMTGRSHVQLKEG